MSTASNRILLDHGSGGKLSNDLIKTLILPEFDNPSLSPLHDGALVEINSQRLAFSTDTFVVDPIFFPGGDIGDLAINGTVNDIAMCGAEPLYLSLGLLLEEGFLIEDLRRIIKSMSLAAARAGITIVTGDTKVVPKGAADKIFINTSGIGRIYEGVDISSTSAAPGDKIILSGTIADHGMTILTQREEMSFKSNISSDTAPLNHMVREIIIAGNEIHVLRDPTRGGVGTALNEIAQQSRVGMKLFEDRMPIESQVTGVCEILGFDPLFVANEGKLLAIVPSKDANQVLNKMQQNVYGRNACIIGEVTGENPGKVIMQTKIGGTRIIGMLAGEQLPRIC